jgi:hypothetical protein
MQLKIEKPEKPIYKVDYDALDLAFIHRNGVGESGFDWFMTAGIALVGSCPFTLFRPNHVVLVIDKNQVLEASGHAARVKYTEIDSFFKSTDLLLFRRLKPEIKECLAEMIKIPSNLKLGQKFDDIAILLIGFKKLMGLEMWRAEKPALKIGSGIHCSSYIAELLESPAKKCGVSLGKKHISRLTPSDLFLNDELFSDNYCGQFARALISPDKLMPTP